MKERVPPISKQKESVIGYACQGLQYELAWQL